MKRLFLDDIRQPQQCVSYMRRRGAKHFLEYNNDWNIVRNFAEFVEYITTNGLPDVISFDHDLAEAHYNPKTWTESFVYEEETGYDCVKWLCEYCKSHDLKLPEYYLHTMNPVGEKNMQSYLENYKYLSNDNDICGTDFVPDSTLHS